jgi:hypothetical protein
MYITTACMDLQKIFFRLSVTKALVVIDTMILLLTTFLTFTHSEQHDDVTILSKGRTIAEFVKVVVNNSLV